MTKKTKAGPRTSKAGRSSSGARRDHEDSPPLEVPAPQRPRKEQPQQPAAGADAVDEELETGMSMGDGPRESRRQKPM